MSDATGIEWTDTTWNPVRGCSKVSVGCTNCYAERTAARFYETTYAGLVRIGKREIRRDRADGSVDISWKPTAPRWTGEVRLVPEKLDEPLRWRKPRRVFVNSMSDLFHEKLSDHDIARVFDTMMDERAAHHTFQVLTKRARRMHDLVAPTNLGTPEGRAGFYDGTRFRPVPPNIWLGVSVENQAVADERIPLLLQTPAAVRFLSVEPLLGAVDLDLIERNHKRGETIGWVIVGGESGPGARPCDVAWIRSVVEQCAAAGVPCFVKQLGAYVLAPPDDRLYAFGADGGGLTRFASKKGGDMHEWPLDLRVRQFPEVRR